ncbi:hypothetical protein BBF96_07105 [Anoxybacter fermentans]|uniref:ATPase P n=1 Tax=Anoxybacter fermentans TaxID=1323375 RepID=A0A3Q9HRZ5_9FIRM|nr:HAD hydrolase family protein [Anoxybacter fermentans]AZR73173.1 hypothetical protein BBF96_07105 [Anoxybacter fermentans]
MIKVNIPERGTVELKYLVLDFNGTLALDGVIFPEVLPLLEEIAKKIKIYTLTADTFGTAREQTIHLPVILHTLKSNFHTREKGEFVKKLGEKNVIAIGNGKNDLEMLKRAEIGIGVLGDEGCATEIFQVADLIVPGIRQGLELLLYPKRLVATLRR